jgi:hypothetical protein
MVVIRRQSPTEADSINHLLIQSQNISAFNGLLLSLDSRNTIKTQNLLLRNSNLMTTQS